MELQFFHRRIPVLGEAEPVTLDDGEYKFWYFDCCDRGFTMRTKFVNGAWRPLQERFDEWLWHDAKTMDARPIFRLRQVIPATRALTGDWMRTHVWIYGKAA